MSNDTYSIVEKLLREKPKLADNYQKLIYEFYEYIGIANRGYVRKSDFVSTKYKTSSILRAAREVFTNNPNLKTKNKKIEKMRKMREDSQGLFVYTD